MMLICGHIVQRYFYFRNLLHTGISPEIRKANFNFNILNNFSLAISVIICYLTFIDILPNVYCENKINYMSMNACLVTVFIVGYTAPNLLCTIYSHEN